MHPRPSSHLSPSSLVLRVASVDPANKTWTCPHCGVIPAKELHHTPGYFIRQRCQCEEGQREKRDQQTARSTLQEKRHE